jgi:hypothetical protein
MPWWPFNAIRKITGAYGILGPAIVVTAMPAVTCGEGGRDLLGGGIFTNAHRIMTTKMLPTM